MRLVELDAASAAQAFNSCWLPSIVQLAVVGSAEQAMAVNDISAA